MLEHSQQLADEQFLEAILADNTARAKTGDDTMTLADNTIQSAPDGIDGLISAPLLASASEAQRGAKVDSSIVERLVSCIHCHDYTYSTTSGRC